MSRFQRNMQLGDQEERQSKGEVAQKRTGVGGGAWRWADGPVARGTICSVRQRS